MADDGKIVKHLGRPVTDAIAPSRLEHVRCGILAVFLNVQSLRGCMKLSDGNPGMRGKKKMDVVMH